MTRPLTPDDLDEILAPDTVRRVVGARVALVDHELLQRDFEELSDEALCRRFPEIAHLAGSARREAVRAVIDDWVLEHAAMVSEAQLGQTEANDPIETDGPARPAYRPPRYGRSVVVFLNDVGADARWHRDGRRGLLDLKGVGVAPGRRPSCAMHSDGLEYLGVALGDYLVKRLVDAIFARTMPSLSTVAVYAVLDLGFDIRGGWRGTEPAGLHVRRAHRRPRGGVNIPASGSPAEQMAVFIEFLLRSYGVTSVNQGNCLVIEDAAGGGLRVSSGERDISAALEPDDLDRLRALQGCRGDLRFERINIQLARGVDAASRAAQVFDFGHFNIRAEFHNPVISTVSDSWLCLGGLIWPDSTSFVSPDPDLAPDLDEWHRFAINDYCFALARELRSGKIDSYGVKNKLDDKVGRVVASWPNLAEPGSW